MPEKDVVITYETLFEILRLEKNREDLQKIDEPFYDDVLLYLAEKRAMLTNHSDPSQLLLGGDDHVRLELDNIRKILKDLYDRREKKILNLALNRSRTGMTIANTAHMLPSERAMFASVCKALANFREGVLTCVLSGKVPDVDAIQKKLSMLEVTHVFVEEAAGIETDAGLVQSTAIDQPMEFSDNTIQGSLGNYRSGDGSTSAEQRPADYSTGYTGVLGQVETKDLKSTAFSAELESSTKRVRFLAPVEEIVGPDLQIYGPYAAGDQISLPKELAQVLIEKKQADEL